MVGFPSLKACSAGYSYSSRPAKLLFFRPLYTMNYRIYCTAPWWNEVEKSPLSVLYLVRGQVILERCE